MVNDRFTNSASLTAVPFMLSSHASSKPLIVLLLDTPRYYVQSDYERQVGDDLDDGHVFSSLSFRSAMAARASWQRSRHGSPTCLLRQVETCHSRFPSPSEKHS